MKDKFFKFGSRFVKYLFYFLFLLTFYFAITSPNLILGDNNITGAGTTLYTTFYIIIVIALVVCFFTYQEFADFLRFIFVDRALITSFVILG